MIVVPFAPSDPEWPTLVAASRTSVVGQRDPCAILPNSQEYAREGDDLCLAVMAVDFSRWSRRLFAGVTAPCGRQCELLDPQPLHRSRRAITFFLKFS